MSIPSLLDELRELPECLERYIRGMVYEGVLADVRASMRSHASAYTMLHFEMLNRDLYDVLRYRCDADGKFRGDALLYRHLQRAIFIHGTMPLEQTVLYSEHEHEW